MYKYKYNTNGFSKKRRARRSTFFASLLVIATIGVVSVIVIDIYRQSTKKQEITSKQTVTSVQGTSINLFKTEYFQFQTDSTWSAVITESTKTHFVYRSLKGPLVQHDLTIDINDTNEDVLQNVRTNRVLPVVVDSAGKFNIVGGAGEHCKATLPKGTPNLPLAVVQKQVGFICNPDSVMYEVKLGVVGGTTQVQMPRPDGTAAIYAITYRNLKFTPDDSVFQNIVDTFQTR